MATDGAHLHNCVPVNNSDLNQIDDGYEWGWFGRAVSAAALPHSADKGRGFPSTHTSRGYTRISFRGGGFRAAAVVHDL